MKRRLAKSLSSSEIIKAKLAAEDRAYKKQLYEEGVQVSNDYNIERETENRYAKKDFIESSKNEYYKFSQNVKSMLLTEAMNKIYLSAIPVKDLSKLNNTSYMSQYINQEGVDNLLYKFKTKTTLLSEISRLVTKYHSYIMEEVDKEDKDTHEVNIDKVDEFIDKVDNVEVDKVSDVIKDRVQDGLEKFVKDTAEDNEKVVEIIGKGKEEKELVDPQPEEDSHEDDTIDTPNTDTSTEEDIPEDDEGIEGDMDGEKEAEVTDSSKDIQESFKVNTSDFNRKINDIRTGRNQSVLEYMIIEVSKRSMQDKSIRESTNKPSIESIIENTIPMYTFLETINTFKIEDVDEEYIMNLCRDLKK